MMTRISSAVAVCALALSGCTPQVLSASPSFDGYLNISCGLFTFIWWVTVLSVSLVCLGIMIGRNYGPTRLIFLPERTEVPRGRYWLHDDGSFSTRPPVEGETAVALNREVRSH